jgi:hypothetical protein
MMKIAFVHHDLGSDIHMACARRLVESARRFMRDVPIVQLTDETSARIGGVDQIVRRPLKPLALDCLEHYAACGDGDWLFLDTDVVIRRDVREIFKTPFDLAVAERTGTLKKSEEGSKFMERMPYNKGVAFSRSPGFWKSAVDAALDYKPGLQMWMGDQQAMCDVIAGNQFTVLVLPNAYNYPPKSETDDISEKAIVHYKGPRKVWLGAKP